jgi:peptidyl-prolyl cis-trans isomerase SurA
MRAAGYIFAWITAVALAGAQAQQQPAAPLPRNAVVLDHVVAVINGSVILESDVNEELSYSVLQPLSVGRNGNTRQRALERLIDRDLILQQMKVSQPVPTPTPAEVQARIAEIRRIIPECVQYHCETDAGWQAFLKAKGLTEQQVIQHWTQRIEILSFIQVRFGSGVRITPAEIKDYYEKTFLPRYRAAGGVDPPPLATINSRIQEILLQQRVSSLLLEWLQSLKSEGSVSILDPAYGKVGTTGSGDEEETGGQA